MIGFQGVSTGVGFYYGGDWVGCGIELAVDQSSGPVYRGCLLWSRSN
jgi:hypothetical protein